jgi:hypothetical protein
MQQLDKRRHKPSSVPATSCACSLLRYNILASAHLCRSRYFSIIQHVLLKEQLHTRRSKPVKRLLMGHSWLLLCESECVYPAICACRIESLTLHGHECSSKGWAGVRKHLFRYGSLVACWRLGDVGSCHLIVTLFGIKTFPMHAGCVHECLNATPHPF